MVCANSVADCVMNIILSVTLYLIISLPTHATSYIYISGHYTACLYVFALPTRWNCRGLDAVPPPPLILVEQEPEYEVEEIINSKLV